MSKRITNPTDKHQETTNIVSPGRSHSDYFSTAPRKAGLSILAAIGQENTYLKNQKQQLGQQLQSLRSISAVLLNENVNLRELYRQRTRDISKTVRSLELAMEDKMEDLLHRQFLLKDLNCGILREIKRCVKDQEEVDQRMRLKKQECFTSHEEGRRVQQQVLSKIRARIGKGSRDETFLELVKEEKVASVQVNRLMQQVNELLEKKKDLQLQTEWGKNGWQNYWEYYGKKRDQLKRQLSYILQEKDRYSQQIFRQTALTEKLKEALITKGDNYQKSSVRLRQAIRKYQKLQNRNIQIGLQRDKIKVRIGQAEHRRQELQKQLSVKKNKKQQLKQQIRKKKINLAVISQNRSRKISQINKNQIITVKNIRDAMTKGEISAEQQIIKMRSEIKKIEERTESIQTEESILGEEISEYLRLIGSLSNPHAEIERTQLMLRLNKNREALKQLR